MELELNNYGFFNLVKPEMTFDYNVNSFRTRIDAEGLSKFLSANEIFLDDKKQITDGSHIFGTITYLQ